MDKELIEKYGNTLEGNDRQFFKRVWGTGPEVYVDRLKAIGFINYGKVLDAGFGVGQWLKPLALLNKQVVGIEFSDPRHKTVSGMFAEMSINNVEIHKGSIESTPFQDNEFDAVFCYSVVLCTDYRKSLHEFYRILKPGGKLYFNSNGLGWYLYNLIEGHNESDSFSPRDMAIEAFENTINYFSLGKQKPGSCIITPSKTVLKDLEQIGFRNISFGAEGSLKVDDSVTIKPFFKGEYYNHEGVIEFLCIK